MIIIVMFAFLDLAQARWANLRAVSPSWAGNFIHIKKCYNMLIIVLDKKILVRSLVIKAKDTLNNM